MTIKQPLTQADLENLADSFITPELAEQAGLFRMNDLEGAEIVGKTRKAGTDYSGIAFPYFFPENTAPREYRLRRDKPDKVQQSDGTIKETGKYLIAPGCRNMLYFPPNCRKEWLADLSLPLVITEGFKQPLALHRASRHGLTGAADKPRFLTLGLSGVWNFRGTIGKTTNSDGGRQDLKGFISDFNAVQLTGRKVIIIYDPDARTKESVHFAEQELAKQLMERGANVYIADCPEREDCSGIDDVLGKIEREQDTDAAAKLCLEILEAAQAVKTEKLSQANQILSLADDIELFHTSDRTAFASIEVDEHTEVHPVNSKSFRDYLSYEFYKTEGKSPSSQALQDSINSLSGKAKFEGKTQDVHIRLASFKDKIYLDLCNDEWQILEIDARGWRVIEAADAPVRFKRTKAMLPLPTPTERGDISKLKNFLNVDEKNFILILAWLVNCFRPDYPFPILNISGEQGTAKTTATKICRELVDPSLAPFRSAPRDERDLAIAAANAWICAFDNLSDVSKSLSDSFCRLSTGNSLATRTLYTDDDETIFTAKRPIILNGIGDIASRPDLLDRALLIKLETIPKEKRKTERKFWAEFEKDRTSIFSALVSAVSYALGKIEKLTFPEFPQMADFAEWATAAEQGLGLEENAFFKAYTQNRENAHSIVLEDSILAEVLQEFFTAKATDGKYKRDDILLKDFLGELKETADVKDKERSRDKQFPKSSKGLRNQIERINPNLREIGLFITFRGRAGGNAKKGASLSLEYTCNQTSPTSPTSQSPRNKAETSDVACDVTQNGKMSNITNITNQASNITSANPNRNNDLASKSDVSDVSDVALQPYSNGNGKAEFVDMEI